MTNGSIVFDRAVDYYDQTRGFPPGEEQGAAKAIVEAGKLTHESKVLEIGIGTGRIALPVDPYVGAYYGIDMSRPMMNRLRAKQKDEHIYLVEGDATRLPFDDGVFDAVVAVHIFHLIPDWRVALNEAARVLKPGAPLIHALSKSEQDFRPLWDAWNTVVPPKSQRDEGTQWRENPSFLEESGWTPAGDWAKHPYTQRTTPNKFIDLVQRRVWSSCWPVSDDDLAKGVKAMQDLIEVVYPDPDKIIETYAVFIARAYHKPAN